MGTVNYYGLSNSSAGAALQSSKAEYTVTPATPIVIPAWAKIMRLTLIGAGGGSGSGARAAATVQRSGGSSGSAGCRTVGTYNLDAIAATFGLSRSDFCYLPTIGIGGVSGASIATDNTDGNNGTSGGTSYHRIRNLSGSISVTVAQAAGGVGGNGGRRNGVASGGGSAVVGPGTYSGAAGSAGTPQVGTNGLGSNEGCGSGGGGGGGGATQSLSGQNIGTVPSGGTLVTTATNHTITGTGNLETGFYFASVAVAGDQDWSANIPNFTSGGLGAVVGIMVRDGIAANAPFFAVGLSGASVQSYYRSTVGGPMFTSGSSPVGTISNFFWRVQTIGTSHIAQYSIDNGVSWVSLASVSITMTAKRMGFFAASLLSNTPTVATIGLLSCTANGGSASSAGIASFGWMAPSSGPGQNAFSNILSGCPGVGGGGGTFRPRSPGQPGGSGIRGGSGGGGSASDNGFASGAGGLAGNGYACVELFSY